MTVYLDASVVVSLFVADANTLRAWRLVELHPVAVISLWTIAEFSSALGVQDRMGRLKTKERALAEAKLDQWLGAGIEQIAPTAEDYLTVRRILRASQLNLRTPDALHLALCGRLRADLASFDKRMVQAAGELGIPAIEI